MIVLQLNTFPCPSSASDQETFPLFAPACRPVLQHNMSATAEQMFTTGQHTCCSSHHLSWRAVPAGVCRIPGTDCGVCADRCAGFMSLKHRPHLLPISPLSSRTWIATAVVLIDRAPPRMIADVPGRLARLIAKSATPSSVSTTCAAPMPNTYFAMLWRRSRESSKPMLNRRKTTPSSAKCCTAWMSLMMLSA